MRELLDRTSSLLAISAGLVVIAVGVSLAVDSPTIRGVAIGGALGVVNLLLGSHLTRSSIAGEPGTALTMVAVGFGARFMTLIALLGLFTFAPEIGVSPAAFGFTFLAFVFAYFAFESVFVLRIQRQEAA